MAGSVDEEALHQLYLWVDNIPLSRPKRNLSRDFSDGGVHLSVCALLCVSLVSMFVDTFCSVCICVRGLYAYVSLCFCGGGMCVCWGVSIS